MKKENSTLAKKLTQYSAMMAPVLALAGTANAQIVYTDVDPDFILTDSLQGDGFFSGISLDMDGDGVLDFTLLALSNSMATANGYFNLGGAVPYTTTGGGNPNGNGIIGTVNSVGSYYVSALNAGEMIDSNKSVWTNAGSRIGTMVWDYLTGAKFGQWKNDVSDKYMGVHFFGGDGAYHYGWVRMDCFQDPIQITLKDFAYESAPDSGIVAGNMGVGVPEINSKGNISMFAFEKQVFISSSSVSGDQMTIAVRDILGKTVLDKTTRESTVRMSLNDLASSMYYITVTKGNEVKTIKVSIRYN